ADPRPAAARHRQERSSRAGEDGLALGLRHHLLSEPARRCPRRLPEGDTERVGALIAAHISDRVDLMAGFTEQPFRLLDAQLVEFLPGSSSEDFEERLVQAARRFSKASSSFARP